MKYNKDETVFEMILSPCYSMYAREEHTSLQRLHTLFEDSRDDYLNGNTETTMNAYHMLRAVIKILRERDEWDENNRCPKPYILADHEFESYREITCISCHCKLRWDRESWPYWNGECMCCGTLLDPNRKEA